MVCLPGGGAAGGGGSAALLKHISLHVPLAGASPVFVFVFVSDVRQDRSCPSSASSLTKEPIIQGSSCSLLSFACSVEKLTARSQSANLTLKILDTHGVPGFLGFLGFRAPVRATNAFAFAFVLGGKRELSSSTASFPAHDYFEINLNAFRSKLSPKCGS